eukprot:7835859-Alexandrium_andersonii.AAC.1
MGLVPRPPRPFTIVGDNLGVVRYAAAAGRLRRAPLCAVLEGPLGDASARGVHIAWQAVRRRFNKAADAGATRAVHWAAQLRAEGRLSPVREEA